MHARTRSHMPELVPELGEITRRERRDKGEGMREKPRDHVISREGDRSTRSFSLERSNEEMKGFA